MWSRLSSVMRRRLYGMLWGVAIGILVDSVMLVMTTAWLFFAFYLLLIPVIIAAIIGMLIDRNKPTTQSSRISVTQLFAFVMLWLMCGLGPIAARWTQLYLESRTLPLCPQCQIEDLKVTVLAFDNTPGYGIVLRCECNPSQCIDYYRNELPKLGWVGPVMHRYGDRMSYAFTKPRRRLQLGDISTEDYVNGGKRLVHYHRISIGCVATNLSYQ